MNKFSYKLFSLSVMLFLSVAASFAQFSGTINVGAGQTYTTLTASDGLFNAINSSSVTGDIIIQITSDIIEPGTTSLNKWVESGTGNYQIRIVPDGTTERVLSGSGANMINLSHVRNVVIDGSFSGTGKFLRFVNTNTGANTLAFLNDCKSDTVINCYFEGKNTATNKSVILIGTTNIAGGSGNDSIAILNNIIKNNTAGIPNNLIRSVGTTTAPNNNCVVSGNEFINWGNDAVGLAAGTGDSWKILNNAFYQSSSVNITTSITGIRTIANSGNGHVILGNSIGGSAPDRSGVAMSTASTSSLGNYTIIAISLSATGSELNPVLVAKNNISNITTAAACGIRIGTASNANIDSNFIDDIYVYTGNNMQQVLGIGIQIDASHGIITNNKIRRIQHGATSLIYGPGIYGISISGSGSQYIIDNNMVDSLLSSYSVQNPNAANTPYPVGMLITLSGTATINKISNNKISNIINTGYFSATGIKYSSSNTSSTNIFNNQVYNIGGLLYDSGNPSNFLVGIDENSGGNDTIYNNTINIGVLSNPLTSIYGMRNGGDGAQVYYNNTINITGSTQSARASSAFYSIGGDILLRNNIFKNTRVRTGTSAGSYAIASAGTGNFNSDYNLLYTPDSICALSGTTPETFSTWKTASNGDTNSVNATVAFVSATDLHIDGTNADAWNVYGRGIAISTISTDMDGDSRSTVMGIPVTIGADEIPMPASTPANMVMIPTTPTAGTPAVFTSAGKRIAEITWTGGVVPNTITGKYYPGVPAPNPATSPNSNSYFELTPDVTTGIPYTIKTYYTDAEAAGIPDAGLWGMKSHTPGAWTGTTYSNSNAKDAYGKYLQSGSLNDFSIFSMTGNATPLAIDLKTIIAKNIVNKNRIDWSTAKESYGDYFELESSTDGRTFKKIAKINAKGRASVYTYWDEKATAGMNYYRLKMTQESGSFIYSKTVLAEMNPSSEFAISVYPNPVKDKVNLKINGIIQADAVIIITDINGKQLQTLKPAGNEVEIDMSSLSTGIYFIKYVDESQTQMIKITKQ